MMGGKILPLVIATVVLLATEISAVGNDVTAEQIHLSVTGDPSEMVVDWVSSAPSCSVTYTPNTTATPLISHFNPEIGYMQSALMSGLTPRQNVSYCIACNGTSVCSYFSASPPNGDQSPVDFIFFADYGLQNDVSMDSLYKDVAAGGVDLILHGGDIAYDLMTKNSTIGNAFMNAVQEMTSKTPYMVSVGNHEKKDNFTQYCERFDGLAKGAGKNSNSSNNFFYSFDYGPVHFVIIDTEQYRFVNETAWSPYPFTAQEQLDWLEADLKAADNNRKAVPWVIAMGHKAWYVDFEPDRHDHLKPQMNTNFTAFSPLFDQYHTDLFLGGHVHLYQRFFPLVGPGELKPHAPAIDVDHASVKDSGHTYLDPKHMTTIISASPGDDERTTRGECAGFTVIEPQLIGTQARCEDYYGYGHIVVHNSTHLEWKWQATGRPSLLTNTMKVDALPTDNLWIVRSAPPS